MLEGLLPTSHTPPHSLGGARPAPPGGPLWRWWCSSTTQHSRRPAPQTRRPVHTAAIRVTAKASKSSTRACTLEHQATAGKTVTAIMVSMTVMAGVLLMCLTASSFSAQLTGSDRRILSRRARRSQRTLFDDDDAFYLFLQKQTLMVNIIVPPEL